MNPNGRVKTSRPDATPSANQTSPGKHVKSTILPLCCLVVVLCIYLPTRTKFATPIVEPVPSPRITRFHPLIEGSGLKTDSSKNESSLTFSTADASPSLTRSLSRTSIVTQASPDLTTSSPPDPQHSCNPVERIVYVKTHKTGSTTTASILERFGYLRNLSFAMGKGGHIISNEQLFKRSMLYQIPNRTRQDFDMLVNHVRYNRNEMDVAVPGAKYVTIIRDPVTQLESAFGYFEMGNHLKIVSKNPFETFMSQPQKYYAMKTYFWTRSRNGQIYDLGFDHENDENVAKIQEKIDKLSKEIDLVMITEYFEESLILLRKLMCWDYSDILYISNGIRSKSHRFAVNQDMANKIRAWSAADVMLYEHFNRTFWKKVDEYGPSFQEDLAHFREIETNAMNMCINLKKNNTGDKREDKLTLKNNSAFCQDLIRADVPYTSLIRKGMVRRAAEEAAKRSTP
ncbi:galactosylceramide sulfotransferase-like [Strongylocentrotus purpuratus]|uniref:Galactosylceramide sulfotransferase n=1 Tax=Strongylocentrotus purpuratus TaxID=7668 RepID=A0A7M7MYW6_STRPU|nr:galactosylceramide sulfotransferase-like [Strongylocentrotus purpuratus]